MALHPVNVPFARGQNEGVDRKLLPNGLFRAVANVRWDADGRAAKRHGYATSDVTGLSSLVFERLLPPLDGTRLLAARNSSLLRRLYRYSSQYGWNADDRYLPTFGPAQRYPMPINAQSAVSSTDCAYANGLLCIAATIGASIQILVLDSATRRVVARTAVAVNAARARVVALGSNFLVTYVATSAAQIQAVAVNTSGATPTFAAPIITAAIYATDTHYDLAPHTSSEALIAYQTGAANSSVATVGPTGSTTAVQSFAFGGVPSVCSLSTTTALFAIHDASTTEVRVWTLNVGPFSVAAGPTVVSSSSGHHGQLGLIGYNGGAVMFFAWTDGYRYDVEYGQLNTSTHAITRVAVSNARLASKPFLAGGYVYAWTVSKSQFLRRYILTRFAPGSPALVTPEAICWRGQAVDHDVQDHLGHVAAVGDSAGTYVWAAMYLAKGLVSSATAFAESSLVYTSTTDTNRLQSANVAGNTYIAGGVTTVFDGRSLVESGFAAAPEIVRAIPGAGGSLTPGTTYQYMLSYEWVDAQGNRHQSTPSDPFVVTLGVGEDTVDLWLVRPSAQRFLVEWNTPAVITAHLYRTLANGSVFYRVSPEAGIYMSGTATIYSDTAADSAIDEGEVIYTQGERGGLSGALPHDPAPGCRYLWAGPDRLIAGGLEEPKRVQWSKLFYPGEPVNWSDGPAFGAYLPEDVTAVAELDGLWYAFTANAVFVFSGSGPDDLGIGEFSAPQRLPSDVGCADWRSLLATPQGLMFQAATGELYLLPRGGGAPVVVSWPVQDALRNAPEVTGAALLPESNVIAFTTRIPLTSVGQVLVFDYRRNEWSVDSLPGDALPAVSCAAWDRKLAMCDTNSIALESSGYTDDASLGITHSFETGDIRPFGFDGWGQVFSFIIRGEYRGDSTLTVELGEDGRTWPCSKVFSLTAADGYSNGDHFDIEWAPARNKWGAVYLRFTNTPTGVSEGAVLNGVTLRVQTSSDARRLASRRRG